MSSDNSDIWTGQVMLWFEQRRNATLEADINEPQGFEFAFIDASAGFPVG